MNKYTMRLLVACIAVASLAWVAWPGAAVAQLEEEFAVPPESDAAFGEPAPVDEEFARGEVLEIIDERQEEFGIGGTQPFVQEIRVKFLDGSQQGQEIEITNTALAEEQKVAVGERVVLLTLGDRTHVFERYRLPALGLIALFFAALAVVFARWRGLTSLLGLAVSVLILTLFVVPQIMEGRNPLLISLLGAFVIAIVSIYLAHGFNRRTSIAVVGTLITISIAIGLAQVFVAIAGITGLGSEEAFYLQTSPIAFVNLKGLLLGGIIIGALGVLDDITTAQVAAVAEIGRANPALTRRELFTRGSIVGREHITSLINTLALAYVGASFPALLLFTVYERPWWVIMNTEAIAEEVIRTLVGSVALMAAVPITTLLAAYWVSRSSASAAPAQRIPHTH